MNPAKNLRETAGSTHTYTSYKRARPLEAAAFANFNTDTPWDLEMGHNSRWPGGLHEWVGRGCATRATRGDRYRLEDNSTAHHGMDDAGVRVRSVRGFSYPGLTR